MASLINNEQTRYGLSDFFLKIGEVEGESRDSQLAKYIQIKDWRFSQSNGAKWAQGSGGSAGKVNIQDIEFYMPISKAVSTLFMNCNQGTHINTVTLECRKAGNGEQRTFFRITLTNSIVSAHEIVSDARMIPGLYTTADDNMPFEVLKLSFDEIKMEYFEQGSNGMMLAPSIGTYSIGKNK